jgi:phage-related tail protein
MLFTDVYGFRPSIPQGYWKGTLSASPGLALVGEKGPELVDFKGGERVYDHGDTSSMLTGGRPVSITVNEARHEVTPQAVLRGLQWYDTMYGSRI